jgi:hypothetical protein
VPGYRGFGMEVRRPNAEFLKNAWDAVTNAAANAVVTVILGTERGGEHLLFRVGELRERGIAEHLRCCPTGRKFALLSAVRQRGIVERRHRSRYRIWSFC